MIAHNIGVTSERTLLSDPISRISIDWPSQSNWVEKVPNNWGSTGLRLIRLILYILMLAHKRYSMTEWKEKEKKKGFVIHVDTTEELPPSFVMA